MVDMTQESPMADHAEPSRLLRREVGGRRRETRQALPTLGLPARCSGRPQLCLDIQVTNLTHRSIRLHEDVRLLRPWTRARPLQTVLMPNRIDPGAVASVRCVILFNCAIGRAGRPLTTIIKISDQRGRWHKLKTRLPYSGAGR
jgi:hypothetical protein